MTQRGKFIVVEGCDGAGKTTAVQYLTEYILSKNIDAGHTLEPTHTQLGMTIRGILQGSMPKPPDLLLASLFAVDRFYHLEYIIKPILNKGISCVCDRYIWSTLAYQGQSLIQFDFIEQLHEKEWYLPPDYIIYLDVNAETSYTRLNKRGSLSIFEHQEIQMKVRGRYELDLRAQAGFGPETMLYTIDADKSLEHVQQELRQIVDMSIFPSTG